MPPVGPSVGKRLQSSLEQNILKYMHESFTKIITKITDIQVFCCSRPQLTCFFFLMKQLKLFFPKTCIVLMLSFCETIAYYIFQF